jgi:hypothetical protein
MTLASSTKPKRMQNVQKHQKDPKSQKGLNVQSPATTMH